MHKTTTPARKVKIFATNARKKPTKTQACLRENTNIKIIRIDMCSRIGYIIDIHNFIDKLKLLIELLSMTIGINHKVERREIMLWLHRFHE